MESITIKVDKNLASGIEDAMSSGYSTKTELIREAIRDKLDELRKKRAVEEIKKVYGSSKKKTSPGEEERIRKEVSKELIAMYDKKFKKHPRA